MENRVFLDVTHGAWQFSVAMFGYKGGHEEQNSAHIEAVKLPLLAGALRPSEKHPSDQPMILQLLGTITHG